jgi:hypothetical protein
LGLITVIGDLMQQNSELSETWFSKVIQSFRKFLACMFWKDAEQTRRDIQSNYIFGVGLEKNHESVSVRYADPTEGKEDKKWLVEFDPEGMENLGFRFLF